jgi:Protein of unknown function (DUF1588)/Protein of unknown function (DUF1587)/Protein of unknown function (DUF1592)/Protein of unknown function (DUF1585)/Protein of unknown function (DUF1595)/Planctomycete cytochrome C
MMRYVGVISVAVLIGATVVPSVNGAEATTPAVRYHEKIEPILERYCYGCHGYGSSEGDRSFDEFASDEAMLADTKLWWAVLKNVRAQMMPPAEEEQPTPAERDEIIRWIETDAFGVNPADPDPGHVTLRRLNRAEYRNTIRDLMGVDYETAENFPPDDSGYGFDNIGDALSLSPLLMEKYIQAAETIVAQGVPKVSKVVPTRRVAGDQFSSDDGQRTGKLSFYEPGKLAGNIRIDKPADYRIVVETRIDGYWEFDPGRCEVICMFNGRQLFRETYEWRDDLDIRHDLTEHLDAGEYPLSVELKPLVPADQKHKYLDYRIDGVRIEGPLDREVWVAPANYARFFPDGPAPPNGPERDAYAQKVLDRFATRAYRRPVDEASVERLVALAKLVYDQPNRTFEDGIGQAMVAVLASPRFLFRVEEAGATPPGKSFPFVDEYALASRLSYFLWSTMPDDELMELASRGELRANLDAQLARMLADPRSQAFVENFTGQWLQARDVETISVDPIAALGHQEEWEAMLDKFRAAREKLRKERHRIERERDRQLAEAEQSGDAEAVEKLKAEHRRLAAEEDRRRDADRELARADFGKFEAIREMFGGEVRHAMRRETELTFDYVIRENRDLAELIDADYTFLNKSLAEYYGIPGVEGNKMRRVELPAGSPRGGVLTQGTMLVVTSNPTRTSPVKRGLFVLDNILGTPAPPPPQAVPPLEAAAGAVTDHPASLREALDVHRKDPLCAGCHARMDPLGLALENFNAIGMWRDTEHDRPIDTAGILITGEQFQTIGDLKKVLKNDHRLDFYRCLTEKLLTYATGRGLEYYDEPTVDAIVQRLESEQGRFSVLLREIVGSAAFQQQRMIADSDTAAPDAKRQARREQPSIQ